MFSAFADDDDEPQQQKVAQKKPQTVAAQPKKQDQPRPQTAVKQFKQEDLGDFEAVTGNEPRVRGGFRGGRGGNRGGRGGARGGRGERREGEEGRGGFRGGRGGFRGGRGERREGEEGAQENRGDGTDRPRGRGRGGRGRGARPLGEDGQPIEGGDEGVLYVQRKEKTDHVGKDEHFKGKRNEQWHPYDRRSGTGRGRDLNKGGHGKGNVGKVEDEVKFGEEVTPGEEVKTEKVQVEGAEEEETPQAEAGSPEKRQREEPVEEEEQKGLTLQEYLASKKTVGLKKEARAVEAVQKANIEKVEKTTDRTQQINSQLNNRDLYATGK